MDYKKISSEAIDQQIQSLKGLRTWVFNHPESALKEFETVDHLCGFFENYGFEVERQPAGMETAFIAKKSNGAKGAGKRVCVMIEYDALPGIGHACGHHLIASSCAGTALGIAAALDAGLGGEVVVVGAPAEETGQGKPILAEKGIYDGFDAAISAHPAPYTLLKPKWIAIGGMDFTFTGKASHAGSAPDLGVNALDALFVFYSAFSALRQQLKDESRIHGIIMEGGSAANIIPDRTRIRLEFRSPDNDYYKEIEKKVMRCADGAALATGCEVEYHNFEPTCCGVTHNDPLAQEFGTEMAEFGFAEDDVYFIGSTDVGDVSIRVPAAHPCFKMTDLDCALHTQEFKDETMTDRSFEATIDCAKAMAGTLLKVMTDQEFADEVMAAFRN